MNTDQIIPEEDWTEYNLLLNPYPNKKSSTVYQEQDQDQDQDQHQDHHQDQYESNKINVNEKSQPTIDTFMDKKVHHYKNQYQLPFTSWWRLTILLIGLLALVALGFSIASFVNMTFYSGYGSGKLGGSYFSPASIPNAYLASNTFDTSLMTLDPSLFPASSNSSSDGSQQWLTFIPTKSSYRNMNGLIAWTVEFTFMPKITDQYNSSYISMNWNLPIRLAQPSCQGIPSLAAFSSASSSSLICQGLAVFNTNTTWKPFVSTKKPLNDRSITVVFARWDSSFVVDDSTYQDANTVLTQSNVSGTGTITIYYFGGAKNV